MYKDTLDAARAESVFICTDLGYSVSNFGETCVKCNKRNRVKGVSTIKLKCLIVELIFCFEKETT